MPMMKTPASLNKFMPEPNMGNAGKGSYPKPKVMASNPNPAPEVHSMADIKSGLDKFYPPKAGVAVDYPKPGIYVKPLTA